MRSLQGLAALALGLSACREAEEEAPELAALDARDRLIRLSMDLRGVHPTEAELFAFENATPEAQAASYELHVDEWLADPRFLGRVQEIFDARFLFRTGDVYFPTDDVPELAGVDDRVMAEIIASEPMNLLEYVVANDLPYTTMVTAPYTMTNRELAAYWGIDWPADAEGWLPSTYLDGRPHAGVLTMTTTWQRYPSMGGNANRHRANAVSKMFLCDDYLSRPIVLNRAAVDQLTDDPETAISLNSGCQTCHASLDPMAANFFGFFHYDADDGLDGTRYRPENEEEWRYYSGKEPAYYGHPTGNLPEFATWLARDSRYADCAVRTVWEGLTQRAYVDEDWPEVEPHTVAFEAAGQSVREAFRSVVLSEPYQAAAARDPELDGRLAGQKLVSPGQLSALVRDVTGYTWTFDGRDGLRDSALGIPVLAGGIDGRFVTKRQYTPTVGLVYVQERLATAASYYVARHDLDPAREDEAKLFHYVTAADTPDDAPDLFDAQIRDLYLSVTARPLDPDDPVVAELVDTWRELYSVEASPTSAWAGVLSVVLRDPRVLFY